MSLQFLPDFYIREELVAAQLFPVEDVFEWAHKQIEFSEICQTLFSERIFDKLWWFPIWKISNIGQKVLLISLLIIVVAKNIYASAQCIFFDSLDTFKV